MHGSCSVCMYITFSCCCFQYCKKELSKGKIAHLRVMLKSIVPAGRNASAVLKDPTGKVSVQVLNIGRIP